jgi:hypothetical protein
MKCNSSAPEVNQVRILRRFPTVAVILCLAPVIVLAADCPVLVENAL